MSAHGTRPTERATTHTTKTLTLFVVAEPDTVTAGLFSLDDEDLSSVTWTSPGGAHRFTLAGHHDDVTHTLKAALAALTNEPGH